MSDSNVISIDSQGKLSVPDAVVIPYIEGDGTGPDIWAATRPVLDAAVSKAYGGARQIRWTEILAGEKANRETGKWLPDETLDQIRQYRVAIKGPLTTPVGKGFRSINVALRQELDLYACVRPVKYIPGIPSPMKRPEDVDMIVFRENTEDVYAGLEWEMGSPMAGKLIELVKREDGRRKANPNGLRNRHQAHQPFRKHPVGAESDSTRPGASPQERHPGPQGKHHEIHGRRLPDLGL